MAEKKLTFEQKIQTLKKIHASSAPEALEQIFSWEERMSYLKIKDDWLKHPDTIQLKEMISDQIRNIVSVLATKEDLDEIKRQALFELKKFLMPLLALLSDDPTSEIRAIEESVEFEITRE
jgi:hypothetical protein